MKFMVSMVTDGTVMQDATPEEMAEMGARMGRFMTELQEAGVLADPGARLGPTEHARTLRYGRDGQPVVTDGPFAETKEQTAGYMVLECEDVDEAVDWVRKMPIRGGALEVRPLV